jgi:peptidoglycan-N-acetylglucosamine deacetylase
MGIQEIDSQVFFAQRSKTRMNRTSLVITLCAILGLLGSLALSTTTILTVTNTNESSITIDATSLATAHSGTPQIRPTPVKPESSPTNTQSPIQPFPALLWQQIAALQSQNHFLYTGNRYLPEIALTFDDGPNPDYTPQVLAILQKYRVKATFFCIGRQVAHYPDLVHQEYANGNLVGNHTWSHPNLTLLSSNDIEAQINLTADAIQQATGVRPTLFRPPYGIVNTRVLAQANLLGLTTIIWNDEARDWSTPGTSVIVSRVLRLAGDGAIILLHDGGGDRSQTIAALPTIITTLRSSGFKFVTLQQMLNDLPKHPASTQAPISVSTLTPPPLPSPDSSPTP